MTLYNDNDPFAAEWLRQLITLGQIPEGHISEKSIHDIDPAELLGFDRCSFFAGIGGWDYAARLAGIPDDHPMWYASLPCQPFSNAGKRKGFEDERHLWPVFFDLVKAARPPIIFGEQVAAAIRHGWLDRIFDDLERIGYACRAAVVPACGVGAPHIRSRLWWAAWLAEDPASLGRRGRDHGDPAREGREIQTPGLGAHGGLPDAYAAGRREHGGGVAVPTQHARPWDSWRPILCLDGKLRRIPRDIHPLVRKPIPAQPGFQSRADGLPRGMGSSGLDGASEIPGAEEANATSEAVSRRLRGYGNSIVPQVAAVFIREIIDEINGKGTKP